MPLHVVTFGIGQVIKLKISESLAWPHGNVFGGLKSAFKAMIVIGVADVIASTRILRASLLDTDPTMELNCNCDFIYVAIACRDVQVSYAATAELCESHIRGCHDEKANRLHGYEFKFKIASKQLD
jgi:hypothetical protein